MFCKVLSLGVLLLVVDIAYCANKYSAEANVKKPEDLPPAINFRTLQKPFRMAKLNLLWTKAQHRLTEPKLKSLYSELKIHDKEELAWKKFKSDGNDKEGLKETEMRRKLTGIMSSYDLLEHFEDVHDAKKYKQHNAFNDASDDYINKSRFKDKKLSKLWDKAEKSGFTSEELLALREEFNHHQEKIDQYHSLLKDVKEDGMKNSMDNSLDNSLDKINDLVENEEEVPNRDHTEKVNMLRDSHNTVRDGYDRLHRLAAKGPDSKEFIEPKVQGLWKIALDSEFTADELESLRVELLHYENRLLKLRHLHAEAALNNEQKTSKISAQKLDGMLLIDDIIKKQARKVEKLHLDLETRIMQRHIEL